MYGNFCIGVGLFIFMDYYFILFGLTEPLASAAEAALDALIDSLKMLPFLFIAFLVMEYIEHKAGTKLADLLQKAGKGGPVTGALIGCIPQCGFSVAAANFYSGGLITAGTLAAVFISTSDEAIPVLLAHPERINDVWKLLVIKVVIGAAAGLLIDFIIRIIKKKRSQADYADICADCGCEEHSIFYSAFMHTVKIFAFILIINLLLGIGMGLIGEERVSVFLKSMGAFQPFIAGIVGLIPNCAASVLITELYADGVISFGSAIAGLSAGSGVGLAVLFRSNKKLSDSLLIMGLVYATGVIAGSIINFFC